MTKVPPNALELADAAGAELVEYDASLLADAISRGLRSPEEWNRRRQAALEYARNFDWATLLGGVLATLELDEAVSPVSD